MLLAINILRCQPNEDAWTVKDTLGVGVRYSALTAKCYRNIPFPVVFLVTSEKS